MPMSVRKTVFNSSAMLGALAILASAGAAHAQARRYDIPAEPLSQSLKAFGRLSGRQIVFTEDLVQGRRSPSVSGAFTDDEALQRLLAGSGLETRPSANGTLMILRRPAAAPVATDQESGAGGADVTVNSVAEVVVTAQKRSERIQDVPVPVTAVSGETLIASNQVRLEDYYSKIPGLSFYTGGHGDANLSVRGVSTGGLTNPTVGVVIDDVPFGSTTALGSRTAAPDLDPSDIAQVELLRGPQGTLYGAASIGGLLKYVTTDPSPAGVSGRVEADLAGVRNGDGLGYGVRGALNLPVAQDVAVRISAFDRRDPGYIDDPALGEKGLGRQDVYGGRISALWRPSADFSVKASALYQRQDANGAPYATVGGASGELDQFALDGTGGYTHELSAYGLTVNGRIGGVNLTSITGYSDDRYDGLNDLSGFYGGAGGVADYLFGVTASSQSQHAETRKFTQEVRLSGAVSIVDWVVGGFYTHEDTPTRDLYYAVDPASLRVAGLIFDDSYPTTYAEWAGFGDLTVHLTDRFDVQVGGRESENRETYEEFLVGPFDALFGLTSPAVNPLERTKDRSFTYLVTPRYRFSPDLMVYARLASGYRPGGPNPLCLIFGVPCQYQPDTTQNYEVGMKGSAFSGGLSFDVSLYDIEWRRMQLQVADPTSGQTFYTNASRARSQGLEVSAQAVLPAGLEASGWVTLNDARLTGPMPPNSTADAHSGDRLPYASRVSAYASVTRRFPISAEATGAIEADVRYVGDRKDVFPVVGGGARLDLPAYATADVRASVQYRSWDAAVFVRNIGDRRGVLTRAQIGFTTFATNYIQPRTVGLTLSRSF